MRGAAIALGMAVTVAALAMGAVAFVGSGIYDIGADDHHTKLVLAIIDELRQRSVAVRAASTWGKGVLFVPGARVGIEGGDHLTGLLLRGIASATLSTLPPDDQPALESLVAAVAKRVLRSPEQDFALVQLAHDGVHGQIKFPL